MSADSKESTVSRTEAGVMTCPITDVAVDSPGTATGASEFCDFLSVAQAHTERTIPPITRKQSIFFIRGLTEIVTTSEAFAFYLYERLTENNFISVNLGVKSFENRVVSEMIVQ